MITLSLLNDLTTYVDGRVAKVVINGSYEITNFKVKEVTGNTLALNYTVPVADINLVALIELKDASNNVLASNSVNIPIGADQMMLHTITVKEAE